MKETQPDIAQFVGALKQTILQSQYNAAKLVNTQLVQLYFFLGAAISRKAQQANWGDKVLETISAELQKELKHLRGFSAQNLKKMRMFYEAYPLMLASCDLAKQMIQNTDDESSVIWSALPTKLEEPILSPVATKIEIGSTVSNQLATDFWAVSFSNHFSIINKLSKLEERLWFIGEAARNNWSNRVLVNHLKNKIHLQKPLQSNFEQLLPEQTKMQAIAQFRDEYLLDFLSIDDTDDERLIENKIVQNIKEFILNLGKGFAFIGNQHKLTLQNREYFTDLLFFNRELQALVAIELKRNEFKPEHAGKLNFYLNLLDKQVRLPHENYSIGIVLCKEKNNVIVEYALQGIDKPMGVATYKTRDELPERYRQILPSPEELIKLIRDMDDKP
jgi:predicted nuclease of restriction endonuclease-like (RecB) superfamily